MIDLKMDHRSKQERKVHPWERANFFSKFTFLYTRGLFWRTYRTNKLEEEDLYDVPSCYKSQKLGSELEQIVESDLKSHKTSSIYRILWTCYGKEYLLIGLTQLLMRIIVVTTIPMTLSKLVFYFQPHQEELSKRDAAICAILLISLNLMNVIYTHNYMLTITALGIKVKTAYCSLIYRKSLKLTPSSLSDIPVGKIVTLMTKDVSAFEKIILYGNDIWIGFVQAAVVCYLMYRKMGVAAFAGVGLLLLVVPIQIYIGKQASRLRMRTGEKTDERLQVTQETISAIKIIKMNTWEEYFSEKILKARRQEVNIIVKIFLIKVTLLLIGALTSKIAFYFLVMTYVWLGNTISAELVYFILSLFQRLRHALNVIVPLGITEFAELHASVKRIASVLDAETLNVTKTGSMTVTPRVSLKEVTVTIKNEKVLKSITITMQSGLTFLTGTLGCGKSVFLRTILGEYNVGDGTVSVKGRISYASQEPWIFPSTLKQNIVFGEEFEQTRYETVLKICALDFDLRFFEGGDNLIIGDNGINLSKGQKARINLARAVYKNCEIYLLDDCLAALDAHVKDHIFHECVRGFLRNKLCILATNNTVYIQPGDNLMEMENGQIKSVIKVSKTDMNNILGASKSQDHNESPYESGRRDKNDPDIDVSSEKSKLLNNMEANVVRKNIYHEKKNSGRVGAHVYKKYTLYGGGYFMLISIMIFFVLTQTSKSYSEKMVSTWVDLEENLTELKANNLTNTTKYAELVADHSFILILFSLLILATTVLYIATSYLFFNFTRKASNRLHKAMVENVINAVMRFFDCTLRGNILNRFSIDLAVIDEYFPFDVYDFIEIFLALCGIIIILITVNIVFLMPVATVLLVLYLIRKCFMPTGRNLQRLESATRSPIVGYLNATLEGLTTIRAFSSQELLIEEFDKHQDLYTSTTYTNRCCVRAFGLTLDISCTIFIAMIAGYFLAFDNDTSVGNVGLAITQAFMLHGLFQYGVRKWADLENKMTSVERVLEYTAEEKEIKNKGSRPIDWPTNGKIEFENVSLVYPKSEDRVLRNLTFSIAGKEKIGIVGRTGAGKTSIISALFRLYDYEGKITIDGVDIKTIALENLRKNMAIIPQDPILFTGTVRSNIDPLGTYKDSNIWSALEKVKLSHLVTSLDLKITDAGLNFSAGQRQLLCLARAIMSNSKIIVLDEATANVDDQTSDLVQNALEENFATCTVITIAHKLHSVLQCDKVMLLENGRIAEYDIPANLLKDPNKRFYKMVNKAGLIELNK